MALIKCPECSNAVSDTAPSCPKCGHVMNKSAAPQAEIIAVVKDKVARGRKIEAIKYYRECVPGTGLAEAKDAVERIERGEPVELPANATPTPPFVQAQRGCMGVIILAMLLTAGIAGAVRCIEVMSR